VSVSTLGSTASQAPTLQLGIDRGKGGQELAATPSKLASGGHLAVALDPAVGRLRLVGSSAAPVALMLTQVGRGGSHTVQKSNIALTPNQTATFSLGLLRVG
jgi:hypothetical protein